MNKNKVLTVMLIAVILTCGFAVQSMGASVEIDPKNYITLPWQIDSTGGTVKISSSAGTGYSLYYQYEVITGTKRVQIKTAQEEYKQAIDEYNNYVKTVNAERAAALDEYNRLKEDSSATEEQIKEAYENYQNIFETTKKLLESKDAELDKKSESIHELYPSYTEANWKESINNKVIVDFSEYSGEFSFVLWVKLTNSEGTYYDVGFYSAEGTKEITLGLNKTTAEIEVGDTVQLTATTNSTETVTWKSNKENIAKVNSSGVVTGVAEGVATITAEVEGKKETCTVTVKAKKQTGGTENNGGNTEEDNEDGLTWTDFSKAKVRLVRRDYRQEYYIVVSDVAFDMDTAYRYSIYFSTDKNSVPDVNEECESDGWVPLSCKPNSTLFDGKIELGELISPEKYELSGDKIYVWVREQQKNINGVGYKYKLQLSEIEVERLPQSPLGTRIRGYFFDEYTTTFLWDYYDSTDKEVKYKIGRITDQAILKAIKNGETGCLDKLMTYAKNATNGYTGSCEVGDSDPIISRLGLIDDAYYYVYFELDTENGKYYPIEDVGLYQARVISTGNYLYNYLDDEFVWNLSDEGTSTQEKPKDDTVSNEKLPNTGKNIIVTIVVLSLATAGLISYKKIKMLKGI